MSSCTQAVDKTMERTWTYASDGRCGKAATTAFLAVRTEDGKTVIYWRCRDHRFDIDQARLNEGAFAEFEEISLDEATVFEIMIS